MTLKFDGWPRKIIEHPFYTTSSAVHHFKAMGELKLEWQCRNAQFESKAVIFFVPCDLEIWQMTLKNNREPLICYVKLCASFQSQSVNSNLSLLSRKINSGEIRQFFVPYDLEILRKILKNNRAPLLYCFKLFASPVPGFIINMDSFAVDVLGLVGGRS